MSVRPVVHILLVTVIAVASSFALLTPRTPVRAAGLGWYIESTITTTGAISDATFTDATTGWAVGRGGGLYFTHDGGETWSTKISGVNDDLNEVAFPNAQTGYAVGVNVILRTGDGGATWQPLKPSPPINNISSFSAPSATTVYVAANPSSGPTGLYKSVDGGVTWSNVLTTTIQQVAFVTPSDGWALASADGGCGSPYHTTDGGATWQQIFNDGRCYKAVQFSSPSTGYIVVGQDWSIIRTTDGGSTWTTAGNLPTTDTNGNGGQGHAFNSIDFLSPTQGLIGIPDSRHSIYATTNGGVTWQDQGPIIGVDSASADVVGYRISTPFAIANEQNSQGDNDGAAYFMYYGYPVPPPTATPLPPTATAATTDTPVSSHGAPGPAPSATPVPPQTTSPSQSAPVPTSQPSATTRAASPAPSATTAPEPTNPPEATSPPVANTTQDRAQKPAAGCRASSLQQVVSCVEPSVLRIDVRLSDGEVQGTGFVSYRKVGG